MKYGKILLWVNCGLFVVFGLGFSLVPESLAAFFTGASPATPSAVTDMRATYGGVAIGLAIIFGACAREDRYVQLGVRGVLSVMAGLASARGLGMILDGSPNIFMLILLGAEVLMAVLAILVMKSFQRLTSL